MAEPSDKTNTRKVSIVNGHNGYDHHAFETARNRKISAAEHAEVGPVRKKSILHNSHLTENQHVIGKQSACFFVKCGFDV